MKRKQRPMNRRNLQFQHDNAQMPVSSGTPTVLWRDGAGNILQCYGTAVLGAIAGYATGCIYQYTRKNRGGDGEWNPVLYVNEGTPLAANFVAVDLM